MPRSDDSTRFMVIKCVPPFVAISELVVNPSPRSSSARSRLALSEATSDSMASRCRSTWPVVSIAMSSMGLEVATVAVVFVVVTSVVATVARVSQSPAAPVAPVAGATSTLGSLTGLDEALLQLLVPAFPPYVSR